MLEAVRTHLTSTRIGSHCIAAAMGVRSVKSDQQITPQFSIALGVTAPLARYLSSVNNSVTSAGNTDGGYQKYRVTSPRSHSPSHKEVGDGVSGIEGTEMGRGDSKG